jgi:hypothetical protein
MATTYNILILDPAIYDVWFAGQAYKEPDPDKRTKTAKEWCEQENADLCFNLGIFGMTSGLGCSYVRAKGRDISYGSEKPHILTINAENQCRGYSDGIIDGQIKINLPMGGKRTRNGIGMTNKGHIIIAQSAGSVTERTFCTAVNTFVQNKGQAVKLFTLQDGGGSTQEYSALSRLNFAPEGGRKVANVVCVKRRRVQSIFAPVYEGCRGENVELVQMALGGIEIDGSAGPGTKKRIKAAQAALAFPKGLQCGVASVLTLRAMGFAPAF